MTGQGWAPQGQGPPAPTPGASSPRKRVQSFLARSLESKGEMGKMESELERDLEEGREGGRDSGKDKISKTERGGGRE